jgi:acetyltransferase
LAAADRIGYPVVLKINSRDITHKSDVGGVRLGLADTDSLAAAYDEMLQQVRDACPQARLDGVSVQAMLHFENAREVLIGVTSDPTFGPIVSFGAGGVAVEVMHDTAVALPPLDPALARATMARTRIDRLLHAYRNVPAVDIEALTDLLITISEMAATLPWLLEMDLNPVLAHPLGVAIVDARIVISAS